MFTFEKDMKGLVLKNINDIIHLLDDKNYYHRNVAIAFELPVKYRLIDIAIAYGISEKLLENTNQIKSFKYLNNMLITLLSIFSIKPEISIQKLNSEMYLSWDDTIGKLKQLEKLNLIEHVSKFKYRATQWIRDFEKIDIISIELKLYNWREALKQAEYNLLFSDYSFVAIDKDRLPSTSKITASYGDKNVGLLAVDTNGTIDPLIVPKRNNLYDKKLYAEQRVNILKNISKSKKWLMKDD
mgnify:CR=1 FL=1|jgi:hypothetical protein